MFSSATVTRTTASMRIGVGGFFAHVASRDAASLGSGAWVGSIVAGGSLGWVVAAGWVASIVGSGDVRTDVVDEGAMVPPHAARAIERTRTRTPRAARTDCNLDADTNGAETGDPADS